MNSWPRNTFPDPNTPPAPFVVGTQATDQLGAIFTAKVFAQTVNAVPTVIDTGPNAPPNAASTADMIYNVTDKTAHTTSGGRFLATVRKYGGPEVVAGAQTVVPVGDASLDTALPSIGVGGDGNVTLTFTPPAGYVGTLDWFMFVTVYRN